MMEEVAFMSPAVGVSVTGRIALNQRAQLSRDQIQ
jgi:hypothetical protein